MARNGDRTSAGIGYRRERRRPEREAELAREAADGAFEVGLQVLVEYDLGFGRLSVSKNSGLRNTAEI